jgi:hypothetical protein
MLYIQLHLQIWQKQLPDLNKPTSLIQNQKAMTNETFRLINKIMAVQCTNEIQCSVEVIGTWFFTKPHSMAAWEGRVFPARYFKTPLELGRLDNSKCSEISRNNREPTSFVAFSKFSKAALVIASN